MKLLPWQAERSQAPHVPPGQTSFFGCSARDLKRGWKWR
jgi:hypothetical protein